MKENKIKIHVVISDILDLEFEFPIQETLDIKVGSKIL